MDRKEKKSDPTQLLIDGAAYFIVISSVLYVIYTSLGSGEVREQVTVKRGWTAHTEVNHKPKAKPSWSLFADPPEVTKKASSNWQFFGSESDIKSTKQVEEAVTKTAVVSEVEEPVQTRDPVTDQVFVSDQEEEETTPPVRKNRAEPFDYWSIFAPDPVEETKPKKNSNVQSEANQKEDSISETIQKSAESFWSAFQVEGDLEKPYYKPSEVIEKVKAKAKKLDVVSKQPKTMVYQVENVRGYVEESENEPSRIVKPRDSEVESEEYASFFAEPKVVKKIKPVHKTQTNEEVQNLFTPENVALLKRLLAKAQPDSTLESAPKFVKQEENVESWFVGEEPVVKIEAPKKTVKKPSQDRKFSSFDSFFVEDVGDSYSWLATDAPTVRKQKQQKGTPQPSFKTPVVQKKVFSGDSWFVEDVSDSWFAGEDQMPQKPVQYKPSHAHPVKPIQEKLAPVGESIFVESKSEKPLTVKRNDFPKSFSLKDLLTTGIFLSGSGVKPLEATTGETKETNFIKAPKSQIFPPQTVADIFAASGDLFDKHTLKKAYQFFDGFFKSKESSPVKEKIQSMFVTETEQDSLPTYGNRAPNSQRSAKKEANVKSYERLLKRLRNLVIAFKTLSEIHDPTLADVENTLLEVMLENYEEDFNSGNTKGHEVPKFEKDTHEQVKNRAEKPSHPKKRLAGESIFVEESEESWLATGDTRERKHYAPPKQAPQPSFQKPLYNRKQFAGDSIFVEETDESWLATGEPQERKHQLPAKQAPQPSFQKPSQQRKVPAGDLWLVEESDNSWLAPESSQKRPQREPSKVAKKQHFEQEKPKTAKLKQNFNFDSLFVSEEDNGLLPDGKPNKKGADWNIQPKVYKSKKIQNNKNGLSNAVGTAYDAVIGNIHVPILDSFKPKVYKPTNVQAKQREAAAAKEKAYKSFKNLINSIF